MQTYDFSPIFRHTVGFDRMQRLMDATAPKPDVTYPPYNIETDGENAYRISIAVAGYKQNELDISLEEGTLKVKGERDHEDQNISYLHRGIAGRSFQLKFNLADHIEDRSANLESGILTIDLERKVPAALKPRQIKINAHIKEEVANKTKNSTKIQNKAA